MSESSSFIDKRNEAFNEGAYPGPTQRDVTVKVHESVYKEASEATWNGKTQKDIQRENEQTVDDLFKQEEIGSVFETREKKLEEKSLANDKEDIKSVTNNGIDSNAIDAIKRELSAQEKSIKEPSVESSLNFVK